MSANIKNVKIGIISSYGILLLELAAGILFTPYVITSLGQSEYGIYSLIGALIASIAVLDFGFGNAVTRYVSQYLAEKKKEKIDRFISLSFYIYTALAFIVCLAGTVMYFWFDGIFGNSLSAEELNTAKLLLAVLLFNIFISFYIGAINAYIQAFERFPFINLISFIRIITRLIVIFVLLNSGYKSVAIVIVDTVLNICTGLIFFYFSRKHLNLKIKLSSFNKDLVKEVFSYSVFIFVGNLADMMIWRVGLLIIGATLGSKEVAVFAVGITIISYFQYISGVINSKLFPMVTKMVTNGADNHELTHFAIKIGRLQFYLMGAILSLYYVYGKDFILLWVGPDYVLSWNISFILMFAMIVQTVQYSCVLILRAKKADGVRAFLQLGIFGLGALGGFFLIQDYGVVGMAYGLAIAIIILNWMIVNMIYIHVFKFKLRTYVAKVSPITVIHFFMITIGIVLKDFLPAASWFTFLMNVTILLSLYVLSFWMFGLSRRERKKWKMRAGSLFTGKRKISAGETA
ncbi:lipopolysaccharide biosynthesis protein [Metabacillus sp. JX24]|uniref:lipopolysaccharide biosynthesis protein n=1 Tax=Metabacillus sp. JX24 TaxID=3240759 RepID=UPI00350EF67D